MKFVENPINTFNGSIDISFPVYKLSNDQNAFPISIRYNSSGIKVSEEAGRIGLGWNLDAGGIISHNILGCLDTDMEYNDINLIDQEKSIYPPNSYYQWPYYIWVKDRMQDLYTNPNSSNPATMDYDCVDALQGGKGQPDVYSYSFCGHSGKFFIDHRNNTIHLISKDEQIRFSIISGNNNEVIGWKAVAPDGSWYYFTISESVFSSHYNTYSSRTYNLTKIVFPNGDQLNFEYENIGIAKASVQILESVSRDISSFTWPPQPIPERVESNSISEDEYEVKVLSRIYSNEFAEEILFYYSSRLDIPEHDRFISDRKLDSIKIIDKLTGQFKTFEFNYFYQNGIQSRTWGDGDSPAKLSRLFLQSFGEKGLPPFEFFYSNKVLPSKQSYAQDYWGYFNGKIENDHITPSLWSLFYNSERPNPIDLPNEYLSFGSNKMCDTAFLSAGSLIKIVYPTGGSTNIEYESNQFTNYFYPSVHQNEEYNAIRNSQISNISNAAYLNATYDNKCDGKSYFFNLSDSSEITLTSNFNWSYGDVEFSEIQNAQVKISRRNDYNSPYEVVLGPIGPQFLPPNRFYSCTNKVILGPGKYGIYITLPQCDNGRVRTVTADIHIEPINFVIPNDFFNISYGGGQRIKEIVQIDNDTEIRTRYEYQGGELMSPLMYYFIEPIKFTSVWPPHDDIQVAQIFIDTLRYVSRKSSSFTPISYDAQGGLVGYSNVTIHKESSSGTNLNNPFGKTKYNYYLIPPITSNGLPNIINPLNGKIKCIQLYDSEGKLVKSTINKFSTKNNYTYYGIVPNLNRYCGFFWVYPIYSQVIHLDTVYDANYDVNTSAYGETTTIYKYNEQNNIISINEMNQNGDSKLTEIEYVIDILEPNPEYLEMIANNVISPLKSKMQYVNYKPVYKLSNEYKKLCTKIISEYNENYPAFFRSKQNVSATGDMVTASFLFNYRNERLSEIINTRYFDDKTYLYGYDNDRVIAITTKANESECGYTGFENIELNEWTKYDNNMIVKIPFTGAHSILLNHSFGPYKYFNIGMQAKKHTGYQASVWIKGDDKAFIHIEANGYSVHSRKFNEIADTSKWNLVWVSLDRAQYESIIDSSLKIKVYVGNEGTGKSYFDDLRFYPLDAQMITYTYGPLVGVTSESDNNNRPTRYEYDGFGRLVLVKDFENNVIKKYEYNYKQ